MKRKLFLLIITVFLVVSSVFAAETLTLKAVISLDKIPKEFYGTWRVTSQLVSTNAEERFKGNNTDLWNLSRAGNVITLDNPFSGAKASITVDEVKYRTIKFKKIGDYDNKKLTDSVQLTLGTDTFTGVNSLKMDTISEIDGRVLRTETATYKLHGEKISGSSINIK